MSDQAISPFLNDLVDVLNRTSEMRKILNTCTGAEVFREYEELLAIAALQERNLEAMQLLLDVGVTTKWDTSTIIKFLTDPNFAGAASIENSAEFNLTDVLQKVIEKQRQIKQLTGKTFEVYSDCLFSRAIQKHEFKAVRFLLQFGADVNGNMRMKLKTLEDYLYTDFILPADNDSIWGNIMSTIDAFTPLFYTIITKDLDIFKLLLQHNAALSNVYWGFTALHIACLLGSEEAVKLLLDKGVNVDDISEPKKCTALHIACMTGNEEIACLLINRGANVQAVDSYDLTPLHYAAGMGCKEAAQLLLERGAEVDAKSDTGLTPLFMALKTAFLVLMTNLRGFHFIRKEDVNLSTPYQRFYNNGDSIKDYGYKISRHFCEMVSLLLKQGADPNHRCKSGDSSLITLYSNKIVTVDPSDVSEILETARRDVVELLIKYDLDLHLRDEDGATPLHRTVLEGSYVLTELLLRHGAKVDAKDIDGETPLHYVSKRDHYYVWSQEVSEKHHKLVQILLENGSLLYLNNEEKQIIFEKFLYNLQDERSLKVLLQYDLDTNRLGNILSLIDWSYINRLSLNKLLLMHLARLNPEISVLDLEANNNGLTKHHCDFYELCLKETRQMRLDFFYEGVNMHDLMCRGTKKLALLAGNEDLIKAFETSNYAQKYYLFADLLKESVESAKKLADLFKSATKSLELLCNHQLPSLVLLMIIEQLNEKELYTFVNSMHNLV